jgi:hypothetical protein
MQKPARQDLSFHTHVHSLKRVRISLKTFEITSLCFQIDAHSFAVSHLFSNSYAKHTPIDTPAPAPHRNSFRISGFHAGPFRSDRGFIALLPLKLPQVIASPEAVEWVSNE